jgi:putative N-acetylmannosamine-6-phosphate epimerase
MNQLLNLLSRRRLTLLVSLPQNSADMAKAAVAGGAEALKVHLNVRHHASGTYFGSFSEERKRLEAILEAAQGVPVGVVPGAATMPTPQEMDALAEMGVDFFDAYSYDMPAWMLGYHGMNRMVAAYHGCTVQEFVALERLGMECLEASIVHHDDYGKPPTAHDLAEYRNLADALNVPVIVPSQKKILPAEVELLQVARVKALMIGAIVTGKEPSGIEKATREFRDAMERLSKRVAG